MQKNKAGQKFVVYAYDQTDDSPKTGDSANITAVLSKDSGAQASLNDTNPTELGKGYYLFDATQAETNADMLILSPESSTADILVKAFPQVIFTSPQNFSETAISADGVISSDILAISGDTDAADNLEATYDGTGYLDDYAPAQQQQLANLSIGAAGVSTIATTAVVTTGTETGTYENTHEADGVNHQIADSGGTTDLYYEFNVGGNGVPSTISLLASVTGTNDQMGVYGWNWSSSSWEQVGTIEGTKDPNNFEQTYSLYSSHVGAGTDIGKVRVRFYSTGLTSSNLYIDQCFVTYSVVVQSVGYADGSIWVDTINGASGTTSYVNGTADNPVDSWADALTLSSFMRLRRFHIAQGSSITFTATTTNVQMIGKDYILDLNGQIVGSALIVGANVSGIAIGNGNSILFESSQFLNCTLPPCAIIDGAFASTITANDAGIYVFERCFSVVAGISTPTFDFGAGIGVIELSVRHYSGGIQFENFGQTAADRASIEGDGQVKLAASCSGANNAVIAIRGNFNLTDNVVGGFVAGGGLVSDAARFDRDRVSEAIWDIDMTDHNEHDTTGRALNNIEYIEKSVYINTTLGTNGVGSVTHPFNDVSDAVDFAEARGWNRLIFLDDATIDVAISNYDIEGANLPTINLNGQNVDGTFFSKVKLTGEQSGSITCREVVLIPGLSNINGVYKEVGFTAGATYTLASGAIVSLTTASTLVASSPPSPPVFDFGLGNTASILSVRKYSGGINIINMDDASDLATLQFDGGQLILESSCSAGIVRVAGLPDSSFTDNSTGTTIHDDGNFLSDPAPTVEEIRTEMDDNSTKLTSIDTNISNLNDLSLNDIISGVYEGDYDLLEIVRIGFSVLASLSDGGGTSQISFRNAEDTKNRVVATVDENGNRTSIVLDGS